MRRAHWLHMLGGRDRRLAAYAAGEISAVERARLASIIAACPRCQREVEVHQRVAAALRGAPPARLTAQEAAAFLPEVNRRIDQGRVVPVRPARRGVREVLWDYPRLSVASALTAVLLLVGLTLSDLHMWGVSSPTGRNGVEILSVDVDENVPVMVFQAPGTSLKIIWVFENSST